MWKHRNIPSTDNLRFLFNGGTLDTLTHRSVRYEAIMWSKVRGVVLNVIHQKLLPYFHWLQLHSYQWVFGFAFVSLCPTRVLILTSDPWDHHFVLYSCSLIFSIDSVWSIELNMMLWDSQCNSCLAAQFLISPSAKSESPLDLSSLKLQWILMNMYVGQSGSGLILPQLANGQRCVTN